MIDLNLVRTFVAIYETGSVSGAAERLHVSQPSVSYALARLRDLLGEPLFARHREGMTPTFFADQLYDKFRHALADIESAVESARHFEPSRSTRRFRLALSDMGELYFLARIVAALRDKAPSAELDVVMLDLGQLDEWLGAGKVDAAISGRSQAPLIRSPGEVLFVEHYVCLASLDHPRLRGELTLESYLAERHIEVALNPVQSMIEHKLFELGQERRIGLRVPHVSVLPEIVAASDLLVTLPSRLARSFADRKPLRVFDLPFRVSEIEVMLLWHEGGGDAAARLWLRDMLRETLREL
jgi:DNA-binding transcriptional LysR family regulator